MRFHVEAHGYGYAFGTHPLSEMGCSRVTVIVPEDLLLIPSGVLSLVLFVFVTVHVLVAAHTDLIQHTIVTQN